MSKRLFDLITACVLLALTLPLFMLALLTVRIDVGRPVLFRQTRIGYRTRPFVFLKFRTMVEARDDRGAPLPDAVRLTRVGRWLRRFSLDELPQLLNVIAGDMSLVGPRPLLPEYLPLYSSQQARRHEVRPGITGWAQVNGRNALTWEEKFALDVWYVDHRNLLLDIKILWLTLAQVLRRQGISAKGHATMPPFTGTKGR